VLAFLDPSMTTFDSLRFRANREGGATEIDQTFLTAADAMAYFNDHVLALGDWTGVSSDNVLNLEFIFDVTSNDAGARFATDFLVGNGTPTVAAIPEPSTYALLVFGLVGMGMITRRRRFMLRPA
jgi:hypothetical protein